MGREKFSGLWAGQDMRPCPERMCIEHLLCARLWDAAVSGTDRTCPRGVHAVVGTPGK